MLLRIRLNEIYSKINTAMNKNNSVNWEGQSYATPSVKVLNVQAEGMLCGSFTGGSIDDATEEDWGTL